jgi:dTDP-glucose pyrophosphorylase
VAIDWRKHLVPSDILLKDALRLMEGFRHKFLVVSTSDSRLLGTLTDGDVRRGLMRNLSIQSPIVDFMNSHPSWLPVGSSEAEIQSLMERLGAAFVPILNNENRLCHIVVKGAASEELPNHVILMAGGLGTRLKEMTTNCPKPMLPVAGKPILERVILNLRELGFRHFHLSVNYLSEMIEQHFGNGSAWGVEISYLKEDRRLGTAGALGLYRIPNTHPILVMNGDVLSKVDFRSMIQEHVISHNRITVGARKMENQIQFGVIKCEGTRIVGIIEKPVEHHLVSAGIYVISPEVPMSVEPSECVDMPELINRLVNSGEHVGMFPIHEYWIDIGRHDDFSQAQKDHAEKDES